jgi:adenylate cyclase
VVVTGIMPTAELIEFLRSLGATTEQIEAAIRVDQLARLPTDLVLTRDATLTASDVAGRVGVEVATVTRLWRSLGIAVADPARAMFSERDAAFTEMALQFGQRGAHGDELFRVVGSSLARMAEAAVSLYVQTMDPQAGAPVRDCLVWAESVADVTAKALRLGDGLGTIFTHHMQEAIERQRTAQEGVSEPSLYRLAVGFVDLVGFTPLALHVAPSELLDLIGAFEARAFEVATAHGGRIVKHIGDEVMFVALDARSGCAIARDLTIECGDGIEPRGGVAFGDIITRHGDYYGPVVNLSSRLAELAIPGEVLVDAGTASAAEGAFAFRPAGRRLLKGFDDPVEVFSMAIDCAGAEPVPSDGAAGLPQGQG